MITNETEAPTRAGQILENLSDRTAKTKMVINNIEVPINSSPKASNHVAVVELPGFGKKQVKIDAEEAELVGISVKSEPRVQTAAAPKIPPANCETEYFNTFLEEQLPEMNIAKDTAGLK